MAQYLKDEIAARILAAARRAFADHGFAATSMATIAQRADVSTGNVYRYFESKEVLFEAAVPEVLSRRLLALLRMRVRASSRARTEPGEATSVAHRAAAEELLAFAIRHRLEVVILLCRAAGTAHEGFAKKVEKLLVQLAVMHYRDAVGPSLDAAASFALGMIYECWTGAMARILSEFEDEQAIRLRAAHFTHYHLAGVDAFFRGLTQDSDVTLL